MPAIRCALRRGGSVSRLGFVAAAAAALCAALGGLARGETTPRQVLAFYYGWWGDPATSGGWVHWQGVDPANERIGNTAHYPAFGAYDSHDPALVERQMAAAQGAGITGFIASWWGRGSFEDKGIPLLLATARRHRLAVSAYYETIAGDDAASRRRNAVVDLEYLLSYAADPAWLRVGGKPVLFVYGRTLGQLSPAEWREIVAQVRHDNPQGVLFVADSLDPAWLAVFDGASTYNITGHTQHKTPAETRAWAHAAYRGFVAAARRLGKIATVTVIPGYDDRATDRAPPRPVTDRWGGETYRALWQEAIAAAPDWVLITSWNEWHEGSELEPSVEYGSRLLDDTLPLARRFLGR